MHRCMFLSRYQEYAHPHDVLLSAYFRLVELQSEAEKVAHHGPTSYHESDQSCVIRTDDMLHSMQD